MGETIGSEAIDDSERVAELIIKPGTYDACRSVWRMSLMLLRT